MAGTILLLNSLLGPKLRTRRKLEIYESGIPLLDTTHKRVSIQFFVVAMLFFGLQFSIAPIVLFRRPRSDDEAVRFTVLGVFLFMVFAKIDSPQWILWYLPPGLMVARSRALIILAVVVSVLNYLVFPVVYDAAGWNTWPYDVVVIARAIAAVTFIGLLLREKGESAMSTAPG